MNAKEFYEFQLNDKTSVVGRQDKEEIIMLMHEFHKYKVKNLHNPPVISLVCHSCTPLIAENIKDGKCVICCKEI